MALRALRVRITRVRFPALRQDEEANCLAFDRNRRAEVSRTEAQARRGFPALRQDENSQLRYENSHRRYR